MRLPTRVGGQASSLIDKDAALRQITMAIEGGVNYLDTAATYHLGASETFLGKYVLSAGYRDRVNIATKLPCMTIRKKEAIPEIFRKQLEKLQVDVIDYYLLHALDGGTWDRMVSYGVIDFMDSIRASGEIRKMGFSFHGRKDDFIRIADGYDWDFAQVQFNMVDEQFQAGIEGIRHAHNKGMGIIVMEPLRGGSLVGKIPAAVQKIYDTAEIKRSPVDWALRWILNHPEVTLLLSGMNQDEHVRQNLEIVSDSLPGGMTAQEEQVVARVRAAYNEVLQVRCTTCAYCMPCPGGIDIPLRSRISTITTCSPSGEREWATPCFWGYRRRTANRTDHRLHRLRKVRGKVSAEHPRAHGFRARAEGPRGTTGQDDGGRWQGRPQQREEERRAGLLGQSSAIREPASM